MRNYAYKKCQRKKANDFDNFFKLKLNFKFN